MPRAYSHHPPRKPFLCAVCGERQPYMFDHRYKSICERCRTTRERDRHRAKAAQRRAA